jgi:hypothetical protein
LPDHAKRTRRLPPEAIALREALERARSPEELLFRRIPDALGVNLTSADEANQSNVEQFFDALNAALQALGQATQRAADGARDAVLEACGLPLGEDGWRELRSVAKELAPRIVEPALVDFLHRASLDGDARSSVEGVLALVSGRPVRSWTDADADRVRTQARVIGSLFQKERASALAAGLALSSAEQEQCQRAAARARDAIAGLPAHVARAALMALLAELGRNQEGSR